MYNCLCILYRRKEKKSGRMKCRWSVGKKKKKRKRTERKKGQNFKKRVCVDCLYIGFFHLCFHLFSGGEVERLTWEIDSNSETMFIAYTG